MKESFINEGRVRRRRVIRVIKINRLVALIIAIGIILSLLVTFFACSSNSAKNIDSKTFYYVQMGEFSSSGEALQKSLEIKNLGGSGHIVNDGLFRVMATVFDTKEKAESVVNKLTGSHENIKVYSVKTKKHKLKKYDGKREISKIKEIYIFPITRFFDSILSADIELDKQLTTDSAVFSLLNNLKEELRNGYTEIRNLLSKHPADKILNFLEKNYKSLENAFENHLPDTEQPIGPNLKTLLCITIELYTIS